VKKDYNYVSVHIRITDKTAPNGYHDGVLIDDRNVKMLVGEFKIMLDKIQMDIKLTDKEIEEHKEYIKKWEADLYE